MRAPVLATIVLCLLIVSMFPVTLFSSFGPSVVDNIAGSHGSRPQSVLIVPHTRTPIKHVIIVIQENHAFDNYFSNFSGAFGLPPGGIPQPGTYANVTSYHPEYPLTWSYGGNQSFSNPEHGESHILNEQDNGSMDGFFYTDGGEANGLFPSYIVANSLGLAGEYGVADNYYTDFAGPTLPNRLYYYGISPGAATSDSNPPGDVINVPNLPQELQSAGISWASYDGNYNEYPGSSCTFALFPTDPCWYFTYLNSSDPAAQLSPELYYGWLQNEYNTTGAIPQLQYYNNIYGNLTAGTLPSVSWFTSDWTCCTEHPSDANASFIGGNVTQGQQSFLKLVHAVEDSAYWNSTAIFLTYDEGGGFFDSSPSPVATPYGTGLRVPLIVISPYAKEGYVSHDFLTPSSLLHFVEWNWGLPSLGWLDNESNLPLDFFNFSETPRAPLSQSVYGSNNQTFSIPWAPQPVGAGFLGKYQPALLTNHDVNWTFQTTNVITNPPVLSGNSLYACGLDGVLRSLNPISGALNWARSLGSGCRSSPTVLPGGGVIATTLRGTVAAYNSTGSLAWNISLDAPIYSNLTLVGTTLYGTLQNGSLFAIDSSTHALLWEKAVSLTPLYASPVYDPSDHFLLLSATRAGVIAVNLTGSVQWTAPVPGGTFAAGALCGSSYYVTSPEGGLYPISLPTGTVGTPAPLNDSTATPLCWGSDLYVGDNSTFRAFSTSPSLTQLWSNTTHSMQGGSAVVSGSDLVVDTQGGAIDWFSPTSSHPVISLESGTSFFGSPLSTPEWLYFSGEDGNVYGVADRGAIQVSVVPTNASVTIGGIPLSTPGGKGAVTETPGSYTVAASAPGYASASIPVTVLQGKTTYANLTLIKNASRPSISSFIANPSSIVLGNSTIFSVTVTGGTLPFSYAYSGLPGGCATGSLANLSCTPTSTGSYTVQVNVTDAKGYWTTASTTLNVNAPSQGGPSITTFTAKPNPVTLGSSTTLSLGVSGGTAPYVERYQGLPTGCQSQSTEQLTCTPTISGSFTVVVTVTDAQGRSANDSLVLVVQAPSGYPTVSLVATPSSLVLGNSTTFTASASGGKSPYAYAYTGLPTGCSSSNIPSLTCTPSAAGTFTVYVTVTDANAHTASSSVTVTVNSPPNHVSPLMITSFTASVNPATVGKAVTLTVTASGGVPPYSFAFGNLPSGCTTANASTLSCIPQSKGTFLITVTVTDADRKTAQSNLTLQVQASQGQSSASPLSGSILWILIVVIVAAVAIAAFLVLRRSRKKGPSEAPSPASSEAGTETPAPSAPPSGEWNEP